MTQSMLILTNILQNADFTLIVAHLGIMTNENLIMASLLKLGLSGYDENPIFSRSLCE